MQVMDGDWQFPFSILNDCFIHSFLKHLQEKMSLGLRGKGVPAGEWIIASAVKTSLGDIVFKANNLLGQISAFQVCRPDFDQCD